MRHNARSPAAPRAPSVAALLALLTAGAGLLVGSAAAVAQAPAAAESPEYKRGRLLYIQCRACHELKAGQPNKVGPNLHGVLGGKAAQVAGFSYSPALRAANLTWDAATLDKWLERPSALVPGNAMAFAGVANPKDRAALLTYIQAEAAAPAKP